MGGTIVIVLLTETTMMGTVDIFFNATSRRDDNGGNGRSGIGSNCCDHVPLIWLPTWDKSFVGKEFYGAALASASVVAALRCHLHREMQPECTWLWVSWSPKLEHWRPKMMAGCRPTGTAKITAESETQDERDG